MEFYMKLPRSKKEFALFMGIVSIISVNIIAPLITFFWSRFPPVCLSGCAHRPAVDLAERHRRCPIDYIPAEKMTAKIVSKGDSFNAHIVVNILCTVLMMSVLLTVIGTWIGTRSVSWEPIQMFFHKWPRNFSISLFVEMCIAQPVARFALYRLHLRLDKKTNGWCFCLADMLSAYPLFCN